MPYIPDKERKKMARSIADKYRYVTFPFGSEKMPDAMTPDKLEKLVLAVLEKGSQQGGTNGENTRTEK
jgi:hypothetical protein